MKKEKIKLRELFLEKDETVWITTMAMSCDAFMNELKEEALKRSKSLLYRIVLKKSEVGEYDINSERDTHGRMIYMAAYSFSATPRGFIGRWFFNIGSINAFLSGRIYQVEDDVDEE